MKMPANSPKGHGSAVKGSPRKSAPQPTKRASFGKGAKVSKTR